MSKFIFLICAVSLSSVITVVKTAPPDDFLELVNECAKQNEVTMADLEVAVTSIDVSKIPSCFWGCGFRKAGFLNDEGQYDVETGVSNLKRFMGDPTALEMLEKVARQCDSVKDKPVSDGKAGCEMGKLAAACFLEQMKEMKMSK